MPQKREPKKRKQVSPDPEVFPLPANMLTPEERRAQRFARLAVAFGDCLDCLVEDGIRHLTDMALAPVKNTLIDAARNRNPRDAREREARK